MFYHKLTYGAIYMSFVLKDSENHVVLGKIINEHQGGVKTGKKMVKTWNFGCFFAIFYKKLQFCLIYTIFNDP